MRDAYAKDRARELMEVDRRVLLAVDPDLVPRILLETVKALSKRGGVQLIPPPPMAEWWTEQVSGLKVTIAKPQQIARGHVTLDPAMPIVADGSGLTLTAGTTLWNIYAPAFRKADVIYLAIATRSLPKAIHQLELVSHIDQSLIVGQRAFSGAQN